MKKIIIISLFLLLSEIISGQNFISLGGMLGKEYTQSDMDTLEYYATQLRN
ncbi:MAG TPA: hypothetical protein PLU49_03305 [Saprospiraceae bacterium]|nr:hypothetical protein [Saprospiraceae bacterium]